jgi:signal transduction histidine kinase/tetratricopeptide (TPR) repeat protein
MKSAMPKRTRIVSLFLFGIALPSLLLGYLAYRGVQNDRALLEKNRVDEHRGIAEQVSQEVDEKIRAAELAFQGFLSGKNPDNSSDEIQQLENLKTSHPLIQEVFAIQQDQSIQFFNASLLYQPKASINLSTNSPPNQSVNRLLQQGERLEFQSRDYKRALSVYKQASRATSDPQIQADLLRRMGRVQKKSRQFKEAIETYRTIADNHSQVQIMEGIPMGLAALMEIGSLRIEMEDQTKALEAYIDLYREMLDGEWELEKESYAFYSDRIQEAITGIFEQGSSLEHPQSLRTTLQELAEIEDSKREETERLLLFQQNALTERELIVLLSEEVTPDRIRRFTLDIGPSWYWVCLSGNISANGGIWGFLVDDQYLEENLLPGIMQETVVSGETDWIIRGGGGQTLLASTDAPAGSLIIESDFIGNFPDWTLEFYQADPRLLDAFLASRRGIYFYMFILITGILVFGLILTIRSLTREMELSRMKSDFVSTVSHEFKSPLTSIRQIAEMLHAGRVPSEERRQKYYDVLLEQSERLSMLTENVLSFAKMEEGKREFVFEGFDLDTLLRNIVSTVQDRMGHEGFVIEAEIEESLPSIVADAAAITQAVNNLLDNALKYSGDSKKVFIRAFNDEQNVIIQVKDFGLGIKQEDRDKIFDRFYRGGDELTRTVKGSGLGLTLVKQIVQAHKGKIQVESEPEKGSVFTIKLPLEPNKG